MQIVDNCVAKVQRHSFNFLSSPCKQVFPIAFNFIDCVLPSKRLEAVYDIGFYIFFSLQGLFVEESSEIASARASSIYRKSFCRRSHKASGLRDKKRTSLSKISEEDSNLFSRSDNQHCDDVSIRKVDDKEMFSDKAITASTSDNNSNDDDEDNNYEEDVDDKNNVVSRFVPEILNRPKVTIV